MRWPKITKDTPLDEIKRIHQRIWQYVIDHGEKPDTPYRNDCVLCEYAHSLMERNVHMCRYCPVRQSDIGCDYGLYTKWLRSQCQKNIYNKTIQLAEAIRDIPFKFELGEDGNDVSI